MKTIIEFICWIFKSAWDDNYYILYGSMVIMGCIFVVHFSVYTLISFIHPDYYFGRTGIRPKWIPDSIHDSLTHTSRRVWTERINDYLTMKRIRLLDTIPPDRLQEHQDFVRERRLKSGKSEYKDTANLFCEKPRSLAYMDYV